MPIVGNVIGGIPVPPKSCLLQMSDGNEFHAVLVDSEVIFTAGANDIRKGKIAANASGPVSGTKVIPTYHTNQGVQVITNGSAYKISVLDDSDMYKYTKLQAIICDYNSSVSNSVSANKVVIDDNMYAVGSVDSLSKLTINDINKTIDFGITNDTGSIQLIRFITYKEVE